MHTNYNKISYYSDEEKEVLEEKVEERILTPQEPKQIHGRVVNCKSLNVRKEDNTKSNVLVVLNFNDELLIEEIKGDWAKVYTSSGILGYVMTKYIKV